MVEIGTHTAIPKGRLWSLSTYRMRAPRLYPTDLALPGPGQDSGRKSVKGIDNANLTRPTEQLFAHSWDCCHIEIIFRNDNVAQDYRVLANVTHSVHFFLSIFILS